MKKIQIIILIAGIWGLIACEKNKIEANYQWEIPSAENANVKFINAYTSNVPAGAPGVGVTRFYIYQNGNKLNGNALAAPGSWPGPTTYASLPVNNTGFTMSLDRRVGTDYGKPAKGDTAFKASTLPMSAGKYYSVFMIGQSPSQSLQVVEDKIIDPIENSYAVRFANFVVSETSKPLDVYSRRAGKVVASGLTYKSLTDFIQLPVSNISDTLDVRDAGQTKTLYSFNNFIGVSRRSYTFYSFGRGTVAPFQERLVNYTNR